MLQPAKVKFRKQQKGRMCGLAFRGSSLSFGDYGLKAVECGRINSRQIESARISITRKMDRGGKVWTRIFPDKPVTRKPLEVRMGNGKGAVDHWCAVIKPGRILYEMEGVSKEVALEAFRLASHKLPLKTKVVARGEL